MIFFLGSSHIELCLRVVNMCIEKSSFQILCSLEFIHTVMYSCSVLQCVAVCCNMHMYKHTHSLMFVYVCIQRNKSYLCANT